MAKLNTEITVPIILAGAFAAVVLLAVRNETMQPYLSLVVIFLVVYIFSFGIAIGQTISAPIKKILNKATEAANGNPTGRVYLDIKGELAELAEAFNKMSEELEASRQQAENTEKSVDIRVRAKTQDLEETISALEQKVRNRTAELQNIMKSLDKLQGQSSEKEQETANLKKQIKVIEEDLAKKVRKKQKPKEEAEPQVQENPENI